MNKIPARKEVEIALDGNAIEQRDQAQKALPLIEKYLKWLETSRLASQRGGQIRGEAWKKAAQQINRLELDVERLIELKDKNAEIQRRQRSGKSGVSVPSPAEQESLANELMLQSREMFELQKIAALEIERLTALIELFKLLPAIDEDQAGNIVELEKKLKQLSQKLPQLFFPQ